MSTRGYSSLTICNFEKRKCWFSHYWAKSLTFLLHIQFRWIVVFGDTLTYIELVWLMTLHQNWSNCGKLRWLMMLARVFCKVWSGIANVAYPGLTVWNGFASKKYSLPWENFDFVFNCYLSFLESFFRLYVKEPSPLPVNGFKFRPILGAFIWSFISVSHLLWLGIEPVTFTPIAKRLAMDRLTGLGREFE